MAGKPSHPDQKGSNGMIDAMRVDKWLWCARFYKTRSLAAQAISKGRILINDQPAKPATAIRPGAAIRIKSGPWLQHIKVLTLAWSRGATRTAARLYQEYPASIEQRRLVAEQLRTQHTLNPAARGRPTKRDRRKLTAFKKGQI